MFGDNLKLILKSKRISQAELGRLMGVSSQYVSQLTRESNPELSTVERIAKSLKVTREDLLQGYDPRRAENTALGERDETVSGIIKAPSGFTGKPIPFYDIDVTGGEVDFFDEGIKVLPSAYFYLPAFEGCVAFPLSGNSMADRYNPGDVIFYKEIDYWRDGYVDFGEIFLVATGRGLRTVKYVKRGSTPDSWTLEPHNTHHHQPFEVRIATITRMFKLMGKFQKDAM